MALTEVSAIRIRASSVPVDRVLDDPIATEARSGGGGGGNPDDSQDRYECCSD
jgi:hypothetical protein